MTVSQPSLRPILSRVATRDGQPLRSRLFPKGRTRHLITRLRTLCLLLAIVGFHGCGFPTLDDNVLLGWYIQGAAQVQDDETGDEYSCGWEIVVMEIDSLFTNWSGRVDIERSSVPLPSSGSSWTGELHDQMLTLRRTPDSLFLTNDTIGTIVAIRDESQYPKPGYQGAWICPIGASPAPGTGTTTGFWTAIPWAGDP